MSAKLNLFVTSFSYKKGVPVDDSVHGGGFVFDCRCLPNPGREQSYKLLTGKDAEVIEYLEAQDEYQTFKNNVSSIVEQAVSKYLARDFQHLSIAFGCTGGQHRSVRMAELIAGIYSTNERIKISLVHREYGTYGK